MPFDITDAKDSIIDLHMRIKALEEEVFKEKKQKQEKKDKIKIHTD